MLVPRKNKIRCALPAGGPQRSWKQGPSAPLLIHVFNLFQMPLKNRQGFTGEVPQSFFRA